MCALYVVGTLKENFKSDTPNGNKDIDTSIYDKDKFCDSQYVAAGIHTVHICVCTSKIKYTCQSWAGFQSQHKTK